jgi:hypothetical protein
MSDTLDPRTLSRLRHAAGVAIGLPMSLLPANAGGLRLALRAIRRAAADPTRIGTLDGYEREVAAALAFRIGERELARSIGATAAALGWLDMGAATGAYFARRSAH